MKIHQMNCSHTVILSQESCMGRCENGFDSRRKCQCDSMCKYYKSCCSDFEVTCGMMSKTPLCSFVQNTSVKTLQHGTFSDMIFIPLWSSRRHVFLGRGRWWAPWRHHCFPGTSSTVFYRGRPSAEAHTAAHLRLQTAAASRHHTGDEQTAATDRHHISESPCQTADSHFTNSPPYTEGPRHNWNTGERYSSWDDHCPRHNTHHWRPRPRRGGLQWEAFWLFHAAKKWLYLCLQRWVTGNLTLQYPNVVIWHIYREQTLGLKRNYTRVRFLGKYFFELNEKSVVPGYPKLIRDVWGIDGPIDAAFTRLNCQGKTYIFKVGIQKMIFYKSHQLTVCKTTAVTF